MSVRVFFPVVWVCFACGLCMGLLPAAESPDEARSPDPPAMECQPCASRTQPLPEAQPAALTAAEVPFVEGQPLPQARPGEGWTLVCRPAVYKTVTEEVLVRPASSYMEYVPAKWEAREETIRVQPESKLARAVPAAYKTETFQVLAEPECTRIEVIPAKYETVEEDVVVREAREEIRTTPAQFHTETEQIEVSPAHTYWKKLSSGNDAQCGASFCMCEVPAKYMTVTKQVLDKEATSEKVAFPAVTKRVQVQRLVADADIRKTTIPAKYVTMERTVLDTPASVAYDSVPAKFETITKQVCVEPESTHRIEIPARYETMTRQVLDQPETKVWRRIKCECGDIVKKYKEIPGTDEKSLLLLKRM